jgi:hypothetical protein
VFVRVSASVIAEDTVTAAPRRQRRGSTHDGAAHLKSDADFLLPACQSHVTRRVPAIRGRGVTWNTPNSPPVPIPVDSASPPPTVYGARPHRIPRTGRQDTSGPGEWRPLAYQWWMPTGHTAPPPAPRQGRACDTLPPGWPIELSLGIFTPWQAYSVQPRRLPRTGRASPDNTPSVVHSAGDPACNAVAAHSVAPARVPRTGAAQDGDGGLLHLMAYIEEDIRGRGWLPLACVAPPRPARGRDSGVTGPLEPPFVQAPPIPHGGNTSPVRVRRPPPTQPGQGGTAEPPPRGVM